MMILAYWKHHPQQKKKKTALQKIKMFSGKQMQKEIFASKHTTKFIESKLFRLKENI